MISCKTCKSFETTSNRSAFGFLYLNGQILQNLKVKTTVFIKLIFCFNFTYFNVKPLLLLNLCKKNLYKKWRKYFYLAFSRLF